MCLNTRQSVRFVWVKVLEAAKKNVYSAAFGQTCVDVVLDMWGHLTDIP